jgi:antibiotic biosynthesis monooxygenase (ABM) superfamily enzyme
MLKHIVMIRFAAGQDTEKLTGEFMQRLTALEKSVPSLKSMEVEKNINTKPSAYHLVLTAVFDDEDGLNAYRTHPDHVKILDRMKETVDAVASVDYFFE